jgi:hypothetical protein
MASDTETTEETEVAIEHDAKPYQSRTWWQFAKI